MPLPRPTPRRSGLAAALLPAALLALAPREACAAPASDPAAQGPTFVVRFTAEACPRPFSGRVLVFLSKTEREPRLQSDAVRLDPVIAADFEDVAPGEPMVIDASNALSFPVALRDLEGGRTTVQAVVDLDLERPWPGTAPGNPCSAPLEVELHAADAPRIELTCDRVVPRPKIEETRYAKLFELRSERLSAFFGHPVTMRALVHLPQAWYDEPERRFPVHYFLSGFGATIDGFDFVDWPAPVLEGEPMVMVYPDPSCPTGHCGFADSDNSGPWASAFTEELVPAIEARYRGIGAPAARFLVGHSSGGWGALWLMVTHPGTFGYVWASSPDPVDFHDFMGVDLYAPGANVFRDADGDLRPFCRIGNFWTVGYTEEHSDRERILRGGVLRYFEALYGARGPDGRPVPLFDRETGAVDPAAVRAWSRFDIARVLRERWDTLGPRLSGRLSITMGDRDNFLLQGSVERLKEELAERGADVSVRLVAGDHFSVRSYDRYREEVHAMLDTYRAWERQHPDGAPAEPRTSAE